MASVFETGCGLGPGSAWRDSLSAIVAGGIVYATNAVMSADHIFLAPDHLNMQPVGHNIVEPGRLVVGLEIDGSARAYPVQFIGYHHLVRDTIAGKPVMVSYCTVCRTGRVFSPVVDGKVESFRLVGMDHFNAMFEDATTRSWWRQATGNAVAGPPQGFDVAGDCQPTVVGGKPVVLAIATDRVSFFAFARPDSSTQFVVRGDSLLSRNNAYGLDGRGSSGTLEPVFASQEFWHSGRTFHPSTSTYWDVVRSQPTPTSSSP